MSWEMDCKQYDECNNCEFHKKEFERLKSQLAKAVDVIEDFDLLSLHAPFCRFPVEECSDQCMNKEYYNLNNLTKRAREFLAELKGKE